MPSCAVAISKCTGEKPAEKAVAQLAKLVAKRVEERQRLPTEPARLRRASGGAQRHIIRRLKSIDRKTMRKRIATLTAAALIALLPACAATQSGVKIYSPAQLRQGEYDTVARLWVDSWRTAFWVPIYSSRENGIAALQDKARALGANGLINVACYGDTGWFSKSEAFTCYGKAIKVR